MMKSSPLPSCRIFSFIFLGLLLFSTFFIFSVFSSVVFSQDNSFANTVRDMGRDAREGFQDLGSGASNVGSTARQGFGLITGLTGSASCGNDWNIVSITDSGFWFSPVILIAIIVAFALAGLYMIGETLQLPNLIAIAKEESLQNILTVARVGFIAAVLFSGDNWFALATSPLAGSDAVYRGKTHMIDAAISVSRTIGGNMAEQYTMLLLYNTVLHTLYSTSLQVGLSFRASYSFNMGSILRPLIDGVGQALQYLSLSMSEWILHSVTLCFIKKYTWSLLIPFGMILRILPFTRSAGEGLLSLGFAIAMVYPFMFVVDYEAHKIMQYHIADAADTMTSFVQRSGLFSVPLSLLAGLMMFGGILVPFFSGIAISMAFALIKGSVYYILILGLLLPVFNIFITLTLARETSKFFGVDVNFLTFLKII